MKHIEKKADTDYRANFETIVNPYVQRGKYKYDELENADRVALRNILIQEQQAQCAYCMKETSLGDQTYDHVIPRYVDRQKYGWAHNMAANVYRNDFIFRKNYTPVAVGNYYPHELAYGNAVLACYNCNQIKDNEIIYPFFFVNDPSTLIRYNEKGRLVLTDTTKTFPSELKSSLNDNMLIKYRIVWRAIKRSGIPLATIQSATKEVRKEILNSIKDNILLPGIQKRYPAFVASFSVDSIWKNFLRYEWFYSYY